LLLAVAVVHLHLAAEAALVDLEPHQALLFLLVQQLLSQLAQVAQGVRRLYKAKALLEMILFFLLLPQQVVATAEFRVNLAAQELALVVLVVLAAVLVTLKA